MVALSFEVMVDFRQTAERGRRPEGTPLRVVPSAYRSGPFGTFWQGPNLAAGGYPGACASRSARPAVEPGAGGVASLDVSGGPAGFGGRLGLPGVAVVWYGREASEGEGSDVDGPAGDQAACERAAAYSSASQRTEHRHAVNLEAFLAACSETQRMEWVGGEVIVDLPATERHQALVLFLATLFSLFVGWVRRGRVLTAPFVMLGSPAGPAREPDVMVLTGEHLDRLRRTRVEGAADLVVEVVSDDSAARDRAEKFDEYQAQGVREYWVIDPRRGRERVDFWVLDAGSRSRVGTEEAGRQGQSGRYAPRLPDPSGRYASEVLVGLRLPVAWLWRDPLPDPILAFAEVAGFAPETVAALRREQAARRGEGGTC